ncbi:MAG TPA: hypothetical protein VIC08_06205 [Cellvibrionaceae bacterium]
MKGKSLVAAVVIVVSVVASLFVYLYGYQQKLAVDQYGFFRQQGEQLVVQFGDQLIWVDATGERRTVDLAELGIAVHGDYDFFHNGDLLVYSRKAQPGLIENLARFFRLQKTETQRPRGDDGFYRCALDVGRCERFGPELPSLSGAFRLVIDRPAEIVYLADTRAFKLYRLSASGEVLAESDDKEFAFPNQLVLERGELWVADTNNHRLVQINTDSNQFAQVLEGIPVRLGGEYRWPHQFTPAADGFWVNVGDNGLSNGRLIMINRQGEKLNEISLDTLDDPFALTLWGDQLLVANFSPPQLQSYSTDGRPQSLELNAPSLDRAQRQAQQAHRKYQRLSRLGLAAMVIAVLAGLGAAWWLERRETVEFFQNATFAGMAGAIRRPASEVSDDKILWVENRAHKWLRWLHLWCALAALTFAVAVGLLFFFEEGIGPKIWALIALTGFMLAAIIGGTVWIVRAAAEQRLGLIGQSLVLQQSDNHKTVAPIHQVRYSQAFLEADGILIFIGNPQARMFDGITLKKYVFPRLKNSVKLGALELLKIQWQARHPQLLGPIAMLVALVWVCLALQWL